MRNRLREAGVPEYRISQTFGKSPEDFQRMNELRIEAGIDPVEGMLDSIPHMLGSADAALAITSLPAFTKTMGQMALPYASMMGESSLGFTDALKGMKDWPEDVPKDWRYGLSAATLPLTAAGGLMGFSRFVPKRGVPSTLPRQQAEVTNIGAVRDEKHFDDVIQKFQEETGIPIGEDILKKIWVRQLRRLLSRHG